MSDDSIIRKIAEFIPGYGGYLEQEDRRRDDRLTREFLVRRITNCKHNLDDIGKQAIAAGDIELPAKLQPLHDKLDLAQSRLASAVEGYAGWFNDRKVDADVLAEVAELDAGLVSLVDQLDELADDWSIERAGDFRDGLQQLHKQLDRRNTILKAGS